MIALGGPTLKLFCWLLVLLSLNDSTGRAYTETVINIRLLITLAGLNDSTGRAYTETDCIALRVKSCSNPVHKKGLYSANT